MYKKLLSLLFVCTSMVAMENYDWTTAYLNQRPYVEDGFCVDGQILPLEEGDMDPYDPCFAELDPFSQDNAPVFFGLKRKADVGGGISKQRKCFGVRKNRGGMTFSDECEFIVRCPNCRYEINVLGPRERLDDCIVCLEEHMLEWHRVRMTRRKLSSNVQVRTKRYFGAEISGN